MILTVARMSECQTGDEYVSNSLRVVGVVEVDTRPGGGIRKSVSSLVILRSAITSFTPRAAEQLLKMKSGSCVLDNLLICDVYFHRLEHSKHEWVY